MIMAGLPRETTEQSRQVVLRLIEEGLNGHDRAMMDALTAEGRFMHDPGGRVRVGRDPIGQSAAERSWALFPDWRYDVEAMLAEGELVAVRVRASGTHASGTPVTTTWTEIFRVRDGKIVEAWLDVDHLGLVRQLEALGERVEGDS
jgi:predicted SnoaL-like aldol condensation-catalyzing enzyme